MFAKYIIRLDDIAENMNNSNFFLLKDIFIKNNIQPLIGVIPNNQDEELLRYPKSEFDFWQEIRELQRLGWNIAVHGYNHKFETNSSGILGINKRSEFAGLALEKQNEKIIKAIKVFNENKINIDAFMAPAHSYDINTLRCLFDNQINSITDGYGIFPYKKEGIVFVPQLFSKPRKMPFGIYTFCFHPNDMTIDQINELDIFIKRNRNNIITFNNVINKYNNSMYKIVINSLIEKLVKSYRIYRAR
ncbi:DUF2334 domain-containing protein [Pseudoneobacillus rhizosphaerae]|uniref:DUF2334 domain-containing protein n=1 Tax=Pseudoneobacillus rhizosphaerae TaxID=2880968 RepID=A0A9C7L8L6_9BACI|nr:DUF2334 domain-containing protein [Pseudoneobacillus rhizosphaerae]CAG9606586.1 hypothetical protein NEOCIP111885_00274 [Pseudoneobacillus rhizosphaerae]